jgi:hypothetical protein
MTPWLPDVGPGHLSSCIIAFGSVENHDDNCPNVAQRLRQARRSTLVRDTSLVRPDG